MKIFTIGHSNHPLEDFLALLAAAGVTTVADVRSMPASRFPWFRKAALAEALEQRGISYEFLGDALGGRPSDPALFTEDGALDCERVRERDFYRRGIETLLAIARARGPVCVMCAEEDPARCHRSLLIAPDLAARGVDVEHIRKPGAGPGKSRSKNAQISLL